MNLEFNADGKLEFFAYNDVEIPEVLVTLITATASSLIRTAERIQLEKDGKKGIFNLEYYELKEIEAQTKFIIEFQEFIINLQFITNLKDENIFEKAAFNQRQINQIYRAILLIVEKYFDPMVKTVKRDKDGDPLAEKIYKDFKEIPDNYVNINESWYDFIQKVGEENNWF